MAQPSNHLPAVVSSSLQTSISSFCFIRFIKSITFFRQLAWVYSWTPNFTLNFTVFINLYSCENKCRINLKHISAFCPSIFKCFPFFTVSLLVFCLWFCNTLYSGLNLIFHSFSKMYFVHKLDPCPQVCSEAVVTIPTAAFLASTILSSLLRLPKSDHAILYGQIHTLLVL